jgi:hypothetical protein
VSTATTTAPELIEPDSVATLDVVGLNIRIAVLRTRIAMDQASRADVAELGRAILRRHALTRPVPYTVVTLGVVTDDG